MRCLIAAVLAWVLAPSATAQDATAYYGLALGSFDLEVDGDEGFTGYDDSADAYHLMVGYYFNEHLAVEGGYGETSDLQATAALTIPIPIDLRFTHEFKILTLRVLGVLPFDSGVTLLGGLGFADVDEDFTVEFTGFGEATAGGSYNEPTYLLGAQYDWERIALRLAYEKYDFDDLDVSEVSLAFFYKL
jgi:opacity protein-like surface antigen